MTRSLATLLGFVTLLTPFSAHADLVGSSEVNLSVTVVALAACQDGIDNDSDLLTDYPADTGCESAADTTETAELSGGGGGGGGGSARGTGAAEVVLRGRAYPGSKVTVLKDGRTIVSTTASPDGSFDVTAKKITSGTYTFSVYGTDKNGVQSATQAFTVAITANVTNIVSGIFLPPTTSIDKKEVRWGDVLVTIGQTNPSSEVTIFVNSEREVVKKVMAAPDGSWLLNFDTTEIERGNHTTQSRAAKLGEISPLSKSLSFKVGDRTVYTERTAEPEAKGDVNGDARVNLVDFSVVAYWFKRANPPASADLNGDGQVTLVDFSILAYNWNG